MVLELWQVLCPGRWGLGNTNKCLLHWGPNENWWAWKQIGLRPNIYGGLAWAIPGNTKIKYVKVSRDVSSLFFVSAVILDNLHCNSYSCLQQKAERRPWVMNGHTHGWVQVSAEAAGKSEWPQQNKIKNSPNKIK